MQSSPVRALQPIAPSESVTRRTYQALRRALLRGEIQAGERLLESALAEQLGVSRTPVREALARLVAEGLADSDRGGRSIVARNVREELAHIYGLRQVLEGYAARLAAARVTPAELTELEALSSRIAACVRADDEDDAALHAHAELTNAFHLSIARLSGNPRLVRLIEEYRDYFLSADFLKLYDRATMRRFHAQHEAILDALRAADGDAAERLVREHFAGALEVIGGHPEPDASSARRRRSDADDPSSSSRQQQQRQHRRGSADAAGAAGRRRRAAPALP